MLRNFTWLSFSFLCLVVFSACDSANSGKAFYSLSYDEALAEAKKQNKVVMIDIGASWCGPCKQMEAETFSQIEVQKFLREHTVAIKIDGEEQKELRDRLGVHFYPTIVFLNHDGSEIGRIEGYATAPDFMSRAMQCVKKS